jgi:multidrug efflux pump subunit AcrA (membrane-fusion protein)
MNDTHKYRLTNVLLGLIVMFVTGSIAGAQDKARDASVARVTLAVEVAAVTRGPLSEVVFADGNSYAIHREFLLFESRERVNYLKSNDDGGLLREGGSVNSSELLAELDRRIENATEHAYRAELDTSRATLAKAKKELNRARRLFAGSVIQYSDSRIPKRNMNKHWQL